MTARITEAFAVRELPGQMRGGRQLVQTLEPLEYRVGHADSPEVVLVPAGFVTDFASVPFGVRNLFPALGRHGRPAIIHDWLYLTVGTQEPGRCVLPGPAGLQAMFSAEAAAAYEAQAAGFGGITRDYDRAEADAIFREAMEVVGVPAWKRTIMYRAVRLGGGGGWGS